MSSADPVTEFQNAVERAQSRQVDTALAALVGACDGDLTLGQILDALGQLLDADPADLRRTQLPVVAELVHEGFLQRP